MVGLVYIIQVGKLLVSWLLFGWLDLDHDFDQVEKCHKIPMEECENHYSEKCVKHPKKVQIKEPAQRCVWPARTEHDDYTC